AWYRAIRRDDRAAVTDADVRALNAQRLLSLAAAGGGLSERALQVIAERALDPATRTLALSHLPQPAPASEAQVIPLLREVVLPAPSSPRVLEPASAGLRVAGLSLPPLRTGATVALLRWLSRLLLLGLLKRCACWFLRLRRELEIELQHGALWVRSRTSLLGKTWRTSEACYALERVTGAERRVRDTRLRSVIGTGSLVLGLLLGGYFVFDGAQGGAPLLLVLGAVIALLGASVDVLMPARAGRVDMQVDLRGARSLRLVRVELAAADRLLTAIATRLSR
ncbi:MAG: hypothetical protein ABW321_33915, partial [Polyangiales bacterium]